MRARDILGALKGIRAKRIEDVKPLPELLELLRIYEEKVRGTEEYERCLREVRKRDRHGLCRRVCGLVAAAKVLGERRYKEVANAYYANLPPQRMLRLVKELVKLQQALPDCFKG